MGCLHDAEDLLLEIDCAISPLYTVGTAWKLRDTYLGAIRDPQGLVRLPGRVSQARHRAVIPTEPMEYAATAKKCKTTQPFSG